MNDEILRMKPIWYYVGLVLIVIGTLVLAAGIYHLFEPVQFDIELRGLHISLWWGAIMICGGVVLSFFNRKPMEI